MKSSVSRSDFTRELDFYALIHVKVILRRCDTRGTAAAERHHGSDADVDTGQQPGCQRSSYWSTTARQTLLRPVDSDKKGSVIFLVYLFIHLPLLTQRVPGWPLLVRRRLAIKSAAVAKMQRFPVRRDFSLKMKLVNFLVATLPGV